MELRVCFALSSEAFKKLDNTMVRRGKNGAALPHSSCPVSPPLYPDGNNLALDGIKSLTTLLSLLHDMDYLAPG